MNIKTIGIISDGKFSRFMQEVFAETLPDVQVKVTSRSNEPDGKKFFSFEEVAGCDLVIPSVPISAFESIVKKLSPLLKTEAILIDVCSIKVYPKKILLENLDKDKVQIICTHPMFGPESYKNNGQSVEGMNMMIENISASDETYKMVLDYLKDLKLRLIEISAEEHDRLASEFQFTTIYTALGLKALGLKRTDIDTVSASRMHDFVDRVGWDLGILADMYQYNPYCHAQLEKLEDAFGKIKQSILERKDLVRGEEI